jgi:predicted DNA-binding transcriptional regulator AlpA
MKQADHRERAYAPRGLRREAAADWVGMSPTKFDEMVKDGRMPKPKRVDGCVVWDRYRLDAAFEDLPDEDGGGGWPKVA